MVRRTSLLVLLAALTLTACGGDARGERAVAAPAKAEGTTTTTSASSATTASTTTTIAAPGTPEHEVEVALMAAWDAQMRSLREVDETRLWKHWNGPALAWAQEQVQDLRARGVVRYFSSTLKYEFQSVTATQARVLLEYATKGVERDAKTQAIRGRGDNAPRKVTLLFVKVKGKWLIEDFQDV